MYICNLFCCIVFSPVNAKEVIFFKNPFVVLGTNTLDYGVHIYSFWLNVMNSQGLPVLAGERAAKTKM